MSMLREATMEATTPTDTAQTKQPKRKTPLAEKATEKAPEKPTIDLRDPCLLYTSPSPRD